MLACHISGCHEPSGDNIVCDFHRKNLTPSQKKSMDRMWRDLVIEKGRVPTAHEDMFQCFYCGGTFTDTAIVADHVLPKGRFQILRYCISNGCPSCVQCNQSDNKYKRLKEKGLTERQLFNELRDNEYQVVFQRYSQ